MVVSVDETEKNPAGGPMILNIYPNPFTQHTSITYFVDEPGWVTLSVYNAQGQLTGTLYDGFQEKGDHTLPFVGKGNAHGFLYVTLKTNDHIRGTKKMLVLD